MRTRIHPYSGVFPLDPTDEHLHAQSRIVIVDVVLQPVTITTSIDTEDDLLNGRSTPSPLYVLANLGASSKTMIGMGVHPLAQLNGRGVTNHYIILEG